MNPAIRWALADRAERPDLHRCIHGPPLPGLPCDACAVLAEPDRPEPDERELDADGWHAGRVLDDVQVTL